MNALEVAIYILELDEELFQVDGNTDAERRLQKEYEAVCASHGARLAEALQAAERRIEELKIPRSGYEEMNARHMADIENLAYENKELRERERDLRKALEHIAFEFGPNGDGSSLAKDHYQRIYVAQIASVAREALSDTEGER